MRDVLTRILPVKEVASRNTPMAVLFITCHRQPWSRLKYLDSGCSTRCTYTSRCNLLPDVLRKQDLPHNAYILPMSGLIRKAPLALSCV
nr:hypothetical protein CFP56_00218 [Quercus suber]